MKVKVSIGEVLDKISILEIKLNKITDADKVKNIKNEFEYLLSEINPDMIKDQTYLDLSDVNQKLWDVEDKIREHEKFLNFRKDFINLARSVYKLNDKRAEIKKEINLKYGSEFVEEKSYQ